MYNFLLKRKLKDEKIATLESLIKSNPDVRELKREHPLLADLVK